MTRYLNAPREKDMEHCSSVFVLLVSGGPVCKK